MSTRSRAAHGSGAPAPDATPFKAWLRLETGQHTGPVRQMQLTSDGKTLLTAGDCTLRVWDATTRQALRVLRGQIGPRVDDTAGHGQVLRFALSRDSRWVAALKSWRTTSPGGRTALATELQVFELATGNLQAAFCHPGRWVDLDFSPDGRWLLVAACGPRRRVTLHTHAWAEVLRAGFWQAPAVVGSAAFGTCAGNDSDDSNDDRPVAARFVPGLRKRGSDTVIILATNPAQRSGHAAGRLCWARLSPTGQLSVQHSVQTGGRIAPSTLAVSATWAAVAGRAAGQMPAPLLCHDHRGTLVSSQAVAGSVGALAFSATGGQLVVGLHAPGQARVGAVQAHVVDTAGGALVIKSSYYGHDDSITAVAFCADGTVVSCGGDNQALHFWSPAHRIGLAVATLRGTGRTLWHAGVDQQERIGFGAVPARLLPPGQAKRQQRFDLKAMALQAIGPGEGGRFGSPSRTWRVVTGALGVSIPLRYRSQDSTQDSTQESTPDSDAAGAPDLTLFVGNDDEWVVFSPSGYYNASPQGDRHFGFHINRGAAREALFLPSDRFSAVFYRRDIIRKVVLHGSEARARAQGKDIPAIDVSSVLPPIVELAAGQPLVRNGQVTLRFKVESPCADNQARRVWVLQNERFAWAAPRLSATGRYQVRRPLQPGTNTFKLLAEGPRSRSLPVTHTVQGAATDSTALSADTLPGNLYLLCVGVSQFAAAGSPAAGNFKPLLFAHKDAIAVHNALGKSRFSSRIEPSRPDVNKAFKAVHGCLLLDAEATKDRIRNELQALCAQIQARERTHKAERDVLFVFLAGHGVRMKGSANLYFWNHDLDPHPERLDDTGLSMIELGEIATAVPAEVVIAMDACHSGMAGANTLAGVNAEELARRIHAVNERGIYVMNAARSEELSHEDRARGHGFFTGALLTALQQEKSLVAEETGGKGRSISMLGLIAAVQELVPYYTIQKQTSVFRTYGDLLPLTIYKR